MGDILQMFEGHSTMSAKEMAQSAGDLEEEGGGARVTPIPESTPPSLDLSRGGTGGEGHGGTWRLQQ